MESFGLSPDKQKLADWIIAEYDRIAYEGLSRILDEVRKQYRDVSTPEEELPNASSSVDIPVSTIA